MMIDTDCCFYVHFYVSVLVVVDTKIMNLATSIIRVWLCFGRGLCIFFDVFSMELEEISREICSESDDGRNNSQEPLNIAPEGLLVETVPRGAKYKNCLKWFGCYLLR